MKRRFFLALLVVTAGCAVLTQPRLPARILPHISARSAEPSVDHGWVDRAGVIHVHTTYSHDAHGKFEDVVRVANAQGLDFVMLTEHNTLQPLRDGKQGWHGQVLVLVGVEISTDSGHYIAFNVTEEIDRNHKTAQQIIDEVNRQGGFGFIAHPYFKNGLWRNWTVTGFTGVEAYNVAHDTLDEHKGRLALWTLTAPVGPFYYSILDRPYDPLRAWDELIRKHGTVTGIGSTDAHEFHAVGLKFAPYEVMFQLIRTHVFTPAGELTPEMVYEALRHGHAYFSIELTTETRGFQWMAKDETGRVIGIMGDEIPFRSGLRLSAVLPAAAQMALFRNGREVATATGPGWEIEISEPGVYRLEASRHEKPWIFSNPIYVRPEAAEPTG
jgi:hypothetical protein